MSAVAEPAAPRPAATPAAGAPSAPAVAFQAVTVPPPAPPAPPPPPPPAASWNQADSYYPPAGAVTPPEVWLVAIGLFVMAGFLLDPVFRYGSDVFPHIFDGDSLVRAFATLATDLIAAVFVTAVALVVLAVGLIRGNRVAQLLVCGLSVVVAIAEIAAAQSQPTFGDPTVTDGTVAVVCLVAVAVIVLLTVPSTARAFFASRPQSAPGVELAAAVNGYLGTIAVCNGVLLCLTGGLGYQFVWIGLGFGAVAAALLATNRYLRAGRQGARVLVVLVYIGLAILGFVLINEANASVDPSTLIPVFAALLGLGALTLPESSRAVFLRPRELAPMSQAAGVGWAVMILALVVSAAVGFSAAAKPSGDNFDAVGDDYTPPTYTQTEPTYSYPTEPSPTYSPPPTLDEPTAYSAATDALASMQGTSTAETCNGELPSESFSDYTIDDVSPDTNGDFTVSATVTMDDGSVDTVSFTVTMDTAGSACTDASSVDVEQVSPPPVAAPVEPADVPDLPASGDSVPTGASPPEPPADGTVIAYGDRSATPTTSKEILEYAPDDLGAAERSAVRDVIGFMTSINMQQFPAAWDMSTEMLSAQSPSSTFRRGYATSRFYQVAFGEPQRVASDLIVIPARFVSRQDPAAQGYPTGVTDCSYWPQYVFVVAYAHGSWLIDVAGKYGGRSELDPFRRTSHGEQLLNPLAQRVAC